MAALEKEEQTSQSKGKTEQASSLSSTKETSVPLTVPGFFHNLVETLAFLNFALLFEIIQTIFGMSSKFQPSRDIPDLAGKVILVTGGQYFALHAGRKRDDQAHETLGNTGLGKETVLQLAKHNPANIFLAARTQSKAEAAIADIKNQVPDATITYLPLDLASFPSIAHAAQLFQSQSNRLDILIHNAGIMAVPFALTSQNHEIQFGTNHVGPFLLTRLLLPTLLSTAKEPNADVRIVALSSSAHQMAPPPGIIFAQQELAKYGAWRRYGQSKLANILFTRELARRYPQITSVSLHPGLIQTDLFASQQETNTLVRWGMKMLWWSPVFVDVPEGTRNQLWAATAPLGPKGVKSGAYYMPVGKDNGGSFWHARKEKLARELWDWSEAEMRRHGFE
ncbi:MAG: hypothetical protein M1821_003145 [Bathelium mastoideum]|nr:MAG: hypothetical protein M1821_003145 [Bathelium mastoideum]